jgi:ABC-2 type transport system ATP-binding protein
MSLIVDHLSKTYDNQYALNDVSFSISSGEIVGLIGPNGAGKSTLMKIICSLLLPTAGDVRIKGISVKESSKNIRRQLGYLPENNPLYTDMYVKEYLLFVAGLYKLGRKSNQRVTHVIEQTGLNPEMNKKIGQLSKGYRQRVGLAQAMIHDPDILILDEPTTGLDPNQITEIRNLISGLGKHKTVILSTHIMQEVEAICKRVLILNKGLIVANDLTGNLRINNNDATYTVIVEFNDDTTDAIFNSFNGIINVKKVKPGTWLIESAGKSDIRENLFRYAVDQGLVILSLHRRDKKLEDVFRDLTS